MRAKRAVAVALGALATAMFMARCDSESPQHCVCTQDFRTVAFLVIHSSGAPVPVTEAAVTQVRTGNTLPVQQPGLHAGVVHVVDDSFISQLRPAGDVLHVVAMTALGVAAVDVTVGVDEPCHCHVQRLSGPDVVTLP